MTRRERRLAYLKGTVVPGIFKDERGFIVTVGDRDVSLYADHADIVEEGGEIGDDATVGRPGKLRVFAVDLQDGITLVLLPQEAGTGDRSLLVDPGMLEYEK